MAETEFVVIGTERGDAAPIALLAREDPESLEYVGGAMVTLPDPERDLFWRAVEVNSIAKPPLPIAKRGASWLQPNIRVIARHLKGAGKLRYATLRKLLD